VSGNEEEAGEKRKGSKKVEEMRIASKLPRILRKKARV
jgi:hypothetical protein